MLDTIREVATPEGCEIHLRLAGLVARARAWFFDLLIRIVVWIILGVTLFSLGNFGAGLFLLCAFLLEWLYPVLFEVMWAGQTPGKKACKLAVLNDDGTPVGWGASFARNTLRFVDALPGPYAVAYFTMLCNRDGKRLGDLVAGTVVVHSGGDAQKPRQASRSGSEAPPFALAVNEQRAIIEFARRAGRLTPERAGELALAAAPLSKGLGAEAARRRLERIANYLLGDF